MKRSEEKKGFTVQLFKYYETQIVKYNEHVNKKKDEQLVIVVLL